MSFSPGYIAISFVWQGLGFARQLEMEDLRIIGVLEYWKKHEDLRRRKYLCAQILLFVADSCAIGGLV
jgi:hypothetical protein